MFDDNKSVTVCLVTCRRGWDTQNDSASERTKHKSGELTASSTRNKNTAARCKDSSKPLLLSNDADLGRPQAPILYPISNFERIHDSTRLDFSGNGPSWHALSSRKGHREEGFVPIWIEGLASGCERCHPMRGER